MGSSHGCDTCVPEQDLCFSPPRGKWVPVRVEMVLVIVLAWFVAHICLLHRLHTPQGAEMV